MLRFLVSRLLYAALVLVGVASLVFGLLHLGGDPVDALLPPGSSPEQRAAIRQLYGLDRPLAEQYVAFLGRVAEGDLGESWRQRRPALPAVLERLPATLALAGSALGLAIALGGLLGVVAAARPGGLVDGAVRALALLGQALPGFWLGTLLILFFAVRLGWLPASGLDGPRSLVLPAVTLAIHPAAAIARLLRATLLEAMGEDYVRTARGKGLPSGTVLIRHALRNAALPALGYVGFQLGFLLGGAVVVEAVFAYPGVGRLALAAVADRDIPLVQAFVLVLALLIVGVGLLVDVVARWLDPRLSSSGAAAGSGAWG